MNRAPQRWHEVPYSLVVDGTVETGSIDALFLDKDIWAVVEFKTDEERNEAEARSLLAQTDYRRQVQRYQRVIKQMLGQEPRVLLCWLNYAGQVYVQADLSARPN